MSFYEVYPFAGCAEPFSCVTHLLAASVFLFFTLFSSNNRVRAHSPHAVPVFVFLASSVLLLLVSGIYHLLPRQSELRSVFQLLDHAAIFLLIAGSITAVHHLSFEGLARWVVILTVWALAIPCIAIKIAWFNSISEGVGLTIYLAFGWIGVGSAAALAMTRGFAYLAPLYYGGAAYTLGALLEFVREPTLVPGIIGPHELFHIAVIMGITFHYRFIKQLLKEKDKSVPFEVI